MAKLLLPVALCGLALLAQRVAAQCDEEYECVYKTPDSVGAYYDLRPLCNQAMPYVYANGTTSYVFTICGNVNVNCTPQGYTLPYQTGVAIQFFGADPPEGSNCTTLDGRTVPCTKDCEVLGVGPPIITLHNTGRSLAGLNVTHYGVPQIPSDPFECPTDLKTGAKDRSVNFVILCDSTKVLAPEIVNAYETSPCRYEIVMRSAYGCGCRPNCNGRNCGSDGCGGYCGAIGAAGVCAKGTCLQSGVCCIPNCQGRYCNGDGCSGSCGTCGANETCTKYQRCAAVGASVSPQPSLLPTKYISTTTSSESAGAFFGGVIAVGAVGLGATYFLRIRRDYLRAT